MSMYFEINNVFGDPNNIANYQVHALADYTEFLYDLFSYN